MTLLSLSYSSNISILELLQPCPLSHHSLAYLQPCLFQKEGIPVCYVISYPDLVRFAWFYNFDRAMEAAVGHHCHLEEWKLL
jgi:hypothetical protein